MRIRNVAITAFFLTLALTGGASNKSTSTKHTSSHHTATSVKHTSSHPTASIRNTAAHSSKHSSHYSKKTVSAHSHGQRTIGEERTVEIQSALIREHYLGGEPSGVWDQQSKDAMMRFQEANGWQTKTVPDARALIKLGLGPDHKGLLNPDTAAVASPHELGTERDTLPGGSSQP